MDDPYYKGVINGKPKDAQKEHRRRTKEEETLGKPAVLNPTNKPPAKLTKGMPLD